jgi:hypothetical protein
MDVIISANACAVNKYSMNRIKHLQKPIPRRSRPARRKAPARERRTALARLKKRCDLLWAQIVKRKGVCWFVGRTFGKGLHECKGSLQAMHGVPRTYAATRHLPINGWPGCAAAHMYFTHHPEEWSAVMVEALGLPVFEELWFKARRMRVEDHAAHLESTHVVLVAQVQGRKG